MQLFTPLHSHRFCAYAALNAFTGSSLAAMAAGTIPETNPITEDTVNPKTIFFLSINFSFNIETMCAKEKEDVLICKQP